MTDEELQAIEARHAASTARDWFVGRVVEESCHVDGDADVVLIGPETTQQDAVVMKESDAEFVAHARQDIPALIAEVKRSREVETAARVVRDTFERSEDAGYRSRDRQFAISILGRALQSASTS